MPRPASYTGRDAPNSPDRKARRRSGSPSAHRRQQSPKGKTAAIDTSAAIVAHFDKLLAPVPLYLRKGPVSPAAPLSILVVVAVLAHKWPGCSMGMPTPATELTAVQTAQLPPDWPIELRTLHLTLFAYGLAVIGYMWKTVGLWPMCSYTMTSWNLQTARLGLLATRTPWSVWLAERLRFPCIAGHSVTFLVWWSVLVPIIYVVLPQKHRSRFTALNTSPLLINVHLLNIGVTLLDFGTFPRRLTSLDLHLAISLAIVYLVFYLLCLDSKGIQLYIILTPRHVWCAACAICRLLSYPRAPTTVVFLPQVFSGVLCAARAVLGLVARMGRGCGGESRPVALTYHSKPPVH